MSKEQKIRQRIEAGQSDANIRFDDACYLLVRLGFAQRVHGSHFVFHRGALFINLQNRRGKIPSYQAAQIRVMLGSLK